VKLKIKSSAIYIHLYLLSGGAFCPWAFCPAARKTTHLQEAKHIHVTRAISIDTFRSFTFHFVGNHIHNRQLVVVDILLLSVQ